MFDVGQTIVHRDHGLCEITGVERVSYVNKDYFVMYPLGNRSTKIMVPCDNADAICRKVISKEECLNAIDMINRMDGTWIQDNKKRKEVSMKLLQSENILDLVLLIKMLKNLIKEKKAANKVLGSVDSSIYNEAVQKLYSEFGYVLGIDSFEDIESFIQKRIRV